jgi:hypothetical protein
MGDVGLEQLLAEVGGGAGRVADVAVGSKSLESQPNMTEPPNFTNRFSARARAPCARPSERSTRSGRRCMNTDVSLRPPWMPMPSSLSVERAAVGGRHRRVDEERLEPELEAQLAQRRVEQGGVAAVAVEQHESFGSGVARQRPRSRRIDIMVSAEYQRVPGDHACSFDLLTDSVGSCHTSSSSPHVSTTAVAVSWAMTWSTESGQVRARAARRRRSAAAGSSRGSPGRRSPVRTGPRSGGSCCADYVVLLRRRSVSTLAAMSNVNTSERAGSSNGRLADGRHVDLAVRNGRIEAVLPAGGRGRAVHDLGWVAAVAGDGRAARPPRQGAHRRAGPEPER